MNFGSRIHSLRQIMRVICELRWYHEFYEPSSFWMKGSFGVLPQLDCIIFKLKKGREDDSIRRIKGKRTGCPGNG